MQDGQGRVGGGVLGGVWRTRLMPVVSHTTAPAYSHNYQKYMYANACI